jgi:hypothetical protein
MDILPLILWFHRPALRAAVVIILIINAKLSGSRKRAIVARGT